MEIRRIDHDDEALDEYLALYDAQGDPGPPVTPARFKFTARRGWVDQRGESHGAYAGGRLVGAYTVHFPERENTHLALLRTLAAAPGRADVRRALFAHAAARGRAEGRRLLLVEAADESEDALVASAIGMRPVAVQARRVLRLPQPGWPELRASIPADGYVVEHVFGLTPDHLLADAVVFLNAMNDAPLDDLDVEDEIWDPDRVRRLESTWPDLKQRVYTTIVRHEATGEPAGYTRLFTEDEGEWARQTDTVVVRGHRGRRLGLLAKLANTEWLRAEQPAITKVCTWNAVSNSHMIAVNERMGYEPLDVWREYELDLTAAERRSG